MTATRSRLLGAALVTALVAVGAASAGGLPAGTGAAASAALQDRSQALAARADTAATTMSADAYRALILRSDALNRRDRLGEYSAARPGEVPAGMGTDAYQALMARGEALNERYGTAATKMSADALRGLHERSVALNKLYHLGDYAQPAAPPATTTTTSFDWTKVVIGVGAALALLVLAAAVLSSRGHWHPPVRHTH